MSVVIPLSWKSSIVDGGAPVLSEGLRSILMPQIHSRTPDVLNILAGANGGAAFLRDELPWREVAKWTHALPKTPTDRYMDVVKGAVRGSWHRWQRHHPADILYKWWTQGPHGPVKLGPAIIHDSCDFITKRGLPLVFPEKVSAALVSAGIPRELLYQWTHLNIFDVAVGAMSVGTGVYTLVLAITGHMPWGLQTFIFTFGLGGLELVAGFVTHNPLLVIGGALKVTAGVVSYWQHIHIPEPSLLSTMLPGLLGGAAAGGVASIVRLAFTWNTTTVPQKAGISAESMTLATVLGALGCVSLWLSLPLSAAYSAGKIAYQFAQRDNKFWDELRLGSDFSDAMCRESLLRHGGESAIRGFDKYLADSKNFRRLTPQLASWLKQEEHLLSLPESCKHVFARRKQSATV